MTQGLGKNIIKSLVSLLTNIFSSVSTYYLYSLNKVQHLQYFISNPCFDIWRDLLNFFHSKLYLYYLPSSIRTYRGVFLLAAMPSIEFFIIRISLFFKELYFLLVFFFLVNVVTALRAMSFRMFA